MIFSVLADGTLVLHLAFIAFILLGGLLAARWPWLVWVHLPSALWGVVIELFNWRCPLTPLENWFRARAGQQGYSGSFVENYLLPIIYPDGLTRNIQLVLAAIVVVVNVAAYAFVIKRRRSH